MSLKFDDHLDGLASEQRSLPRWLLVALVLYAVLTLWLTLHHEAWGDEADTWVLMRDGGVGVMLSGTGSAGTPALWYLLLAPLASAGLPYLAQQLLNLLLTWCAMLLFALFAPFRPAVKALFLFSYYPACQYAVQARPYSLLVALLFGVAATWREREQKPLRVAVLAALLANTTVHGLLIAAVIGALFLAESFVRGQIARPRMLMAIAIIVAGGLLSAIQLWVPPEKHPPGTPLAHWPRLHRYVDPGTVPYAIGFAFLPGVEPRVSFVVGLIILLLAVLSIGHRFVPLLFITFSISLLLLLFVYVWLAGLRHTGLILIVLLSGVWMAGAELSSAEPWRATARRLFEVTLMLTFCWGIYFTVQEAIAETKWAYSGSREMGEYIAGHVGRDTIIAAEPRVYSVAVLAYLPGRRFWFVGSEEYGSYMLWGRTFNPLPMDVAVAMARRRFAGRKWVLLVNAELSREDSQGLHLLYSNRQTVYGVKGERYWLYSPD